MRKSALVVALVAVVGFWSCGKKPPPQAPRPVAPEAPPPAPPPAPRDVAPQQDEYAKLKQMAADEIDRMGLLADIHFDYDKADIREGDRAILSKNADVLKRFDFLKVTVEGHCDERGSVEYNLALGERRAKAARDFLVSYGIAAGRLTTISYGKERPFDNGHDEDSWSKNRRAHFEAK